MKAEAIADALDLIAREKISLSAIVHLLPLLGGMRRAGRFVVDGSTSQALENLAASVGLSSVCCDVELSEIGRDWISFQSSALPTTDKLVCIAETHQTAMQLMDAEWTGDFQNAGLLLGYPNCCVEAYERISAISSFWPDAYLGKSLEVSAWCNRLVILFGHFPASGELFPCSMTCSQAIEFGQSNLSALRSLRMHRLADAIFENSKPNLVWSQGALRSASDPVVADGEHRIRYVRDGFGE